MRGNLQGKSKTRKLLESWPVLIFFAFLTFFFTWQLFGFWQKMEDTKENRRIAEEKVKTLKESEAALSESIESLQTEAGIEENIRNKFGLAKDGEGVIVIVEDKNAEIPETKDEGNWFSRVWRKWFYE